MNAPTTKTCPYCASDETRTVQNIYDIAKNYSRSSLGRVAVTGGAGFYLGGSNVRPTEDTIRAAKFPPPPRPRFSWWTFVSVVLTVAFAYFVLTELLRVSALAALGVSLLAIVADYAGQSLLHRARMSAYEKNHAEWQKQRVCLKCERAFVPGQTATITVS